MRRRVKGNVSLSLLLFFFFFLIFLSLFFHTHVSTISTLISPPAARGSARSRYALCVPVVKFYYARQLKRCKLGEMTDTPRDNFTFTYFTSTPHRPFH